MSFLQSTGGLPVLAFRVFSASFPHLFFFFILTEVTKSSLRQKLHFGSSCFCQELWISVHVPRQLLCLLD